MGQLILKDIFLQRYMFILYFVTSILIFISMAPEQNGFVISCMTLGVMGVSVSMYIEERNKSESVIISLPLLRRDIVIAKYISTLIFLIVSIAITYFIVFCIGQFNNWKEGTIFKSIVVDIPWHVVFTGILCPIIFSAFTLPVQYLAKYQVVRAVSILVIFLIVMLCGMFGNIPAEKVGPLSEWITNSDRLISLLVIIVGVISLYVCSLFFSIKLFQDKDLYNE